MLCRIALLIPFLFLSAVPDVHPSALPVPSHNIKVEFDLRAHTFKALDHLKINPDEREEFTASIHKDIVVTSIRSSDNRGLSFSFKDEEGDKKRLTLSLPPAAKGEIDLEIEFNGRFGEFPREIRFSREFISDRPVAYIGEEIILLDGSSCWYPCMEGSATFNVTATTPAGYEVVMEGSRSSRKEESGKIITTWDFPYPAFSIYLVGGRYRITEDKYHDITLYTYLFPEDINLANTYIEHTKRYLEIYERLFGRYPFKKFAVVENVLPTGYGMPSYTLLGQSVLRLPFIVKTSLGHEIAHNWWGNSVYPDYETGNWSEGLTTYVADHLYDEMDGKGAMYRNQLLRDYTTYVEPSKDYPLTKFKSRAGSEDRAIGYGKGAYAFHMLRVMLGDEAFYDGLKDVAVSRSFKSTSWGDFKAAFEKVSGKDLGWFFKQWVEGTGAPTISLGDVRLTENAECRMRSAGKGKCRYTVRAEILQKERAYEIYLPVLVETKNGPMLTYHWIRRLGNTLEIEVLSRPKSITIDPHYDLFRRLNPGEIPATIGKFLGSKNRIMVLPSKGEREILDAYSKTASSLDIDTVKVDKDVKEEDIKRGSLYILGGANENIWAEKLISKLPPNIKIEGETIYVNGKAYDKKDSILVVAIASPYNPGSLFFLLSGYNPEYIASVGERVIHYGKYSYLLFVNGENVEKGVWEAEKIGKTF